MDPEQPPLTNPDKNVNFLKKKMLAVYFSGVVMRTRFAVGVLGAAAGVAVALAGHAAADAIEDGWPYGTDTYMDAPGYIDGSSWTNRGGEQFGPIGTSYGEYTG